MRRASHAWLFRGGSKGIPGSAGCTCACSFFIILSMLSFVSLSNLPSTQVFVALMCLLCTPMTKTESIVVGWIPPLAEIGGHTRHVPYIGSLTAQLEISFQQQKSVFLTNPCVTGIVQAPRTFGQTFVQCQNISLHKPFAHKEFRICKLFTPFYSTI